MSEIKNLKKLAGRIKEAIKRKETIVLYADSDLDGVVALMIVKEIILNLGGQKPVIYFSDRKSEEHGINKEALEFLKEKSPALFLSLDCGISDFVEIEMAKKLGFEVAILDHHEIPKKLPKIPIIVDPKQGKKDDYFYHLATAGIAFHLAEMMLGNKLQGNLREDMAGLTAFATISDMSPATEANKTLIEGGLPFLETSMRPAIRMMFDSSLVKDCLSTRGIIDKLVKIINITDKEKDLSELYLLLITVSEDEAKERFSRFLQKGSERQVIIEKLSEALNKRLFKKNDESIIFEGDKTWPYRFLSTVASRTVIFSQKPVLLFVIEEESNRGAFRMPPQKDGIAALNKCSKYLDSCGGHAAAGGFIFKDKNTKELKQCLIKYFQKKS
ncbi:MAG: DHH family phosphoesterase [bacterium]|nr:DHH family phosphoesterase [bacterium]